MLDQYLKSNCTQQERAELNSFLNDPANEPQLTAFFEEKWNDKDFSSPEIDPARSEEILQNVFDAEPEESRIPGETIRMIPWWRSSVAIILILLCASGAYLYFSRQKVATGEILAKKIDREEPVRPGKTKATLTLSDGKQKLLDSVNVGTVAHEGSVEVLSSGSQVSYSRADAPLIPERYNTITTKRGETYAVTLSDGTKVWLNAGSSLKFPVGFSQQLRRVEVTGEAYFEVTKDQNRPFQVAVRDLTVQVLGTHFNVKGYDDEPQLRTTLIEGSVELINGKNRVRIRPGQQGSINRKGRFEVRELDDPDGVVAWKRGTFSFQDDDLETVLREVARWYDVELVYKGHVSNRHFIGGFQKSFPIQTIITSLNSYVHLKLDGRKLIVNQ